jgi:hypothetical protein
MPLDLTSKETTDRIEQWAKFTVIQLVAIGVFYAAIKWWQKKKGVQ